MHFKKKFWAPKMHGVRLFTSQSILADPQSPFHLIHDVSSGSAMVYYFCFIESDTIDMYLSGSSKLTLWGAKSREKKNALCSAYMLLFIIQQWQLYNKNN